MIQTKIEMTEYDPMNFLECGTEILFPLSLAISQCQSSSSKIVELNVQCMFNEELEQRILNSIIKDHLNDKTVIFLKELRDTKMDTLYNRSYFYKNEFIHISNLLSVTDYNVYLYIGNTIGKYTYDYICRKYYEDEED